ncbi:MAG: hypothetical protein Q7R58_00930 [bacterium]|nr:hypothetical protein [bacterium]
MRRTLIIIAIVIVLAGAGAAAYFYFFANKASITVAPAGSTNLPAAGGTIQTPTTENGATTTPSVSPSAPTIPARLVKISAGPVVSGEVVINKAATASSSADIAVSYIERQSGNVYTYSVGAGTRTRTSNRTVPGIQSASWLPDASLAFVRYLSDSDFSTINSYALPADGSNGFYLPQNLSDISVSSTSILTLSSGVNGSIASLSRTDGTRLSEIFTTPLSSLRISFAGKNQYFAYTKPSARVSGSAFLIDSAGGFSRVAGPKNGLVAKASPSGRWVLVSHVNGGVMQMGLVNTLTGENLPLPVTTIADKCVWTMNDSAIYCGIPVSPSPNFNYPDDWYQGAVSFTDRIWKIDVAGRYAQFVLDFSKENNGELDAQALSIDPLNTVLVFVNKNDGSLWSYQL